MYRLGAWAWGVVLIAWLVFVVLALRRGPDDLWYQSLKDHDSLSAAITAVLGVVWSWFLQLARKTRAKKD